MNRIVLLALLLLPLAGIGQQTREPLFPPSEIQRQNPILLPPISSPEWVIFQQRSVQKELAITLNQSKDLQDLEGLPLIPAEILAWVTCRSFTLEMLHNMMPQLREHYLTTNLTKAQYTRLRQIVFQLKEREFGAHAAFTMIAKDLGLRPDQLDDVKSIRGMRVEEITKLVTSGERFDKVKPKVEATNSDSFDRMAEMLTRAQREKLKELRGEKFAGKVELDVKEEGPRGPNYPPRLFGVYDLELRYLANAKIREELKLSAKQSEEVIAAAAAWEEKFVHYDPNADRLAWELHDFTSQALAKNLDEPQRARLAQIMMQRRAMSSPAAMCGHPAAVEALKLTPIQLKNLREGKPIQEILDAKQKKLADNLVGNAFDLPSGVADPFLPVKRGGPSAWSNQAFSLYFLVRAERFRLTDAQIKQLRTLGEEEPKFFDLIQKELSFAASAPVAGAGRGFTAGGAVAEQYRSAIEQQCWDVLDEKQKSLARSAFGGSNFYGRRR